MLKQLLVEARRYHPSCRGGLCNHLPMALIALDRMGATPARLEVHAKANLSGMEPAPVPGTAIHQGNWRERLGEEAAYADYLGFFRREIARTGARGALRAALPALAPGVSAAAFHPLIRTAFGLIADDGEEIAVGLAYWASRYLPLPHSADAAGDALIPHASDPVALLRLLQERTEFAFPADADNLIDREMASAAENSSYPAIVASLDVDELTLDRLRQAAAHLFFAADDFNSLHAVTGLHAASLLADLTIDRRAYAREVWRALLALYLSLDRPALPDAETLAEATARDLPGWDTILPAAVASDDEHVIKLVYACLAETRAGGGKLYRYLAARKAGLLAATESRSLAPA